MKVYKNNIDMQCGASLLEVILAIALSLMLVPFMYNQIADMNNTVKGVAIANRIVKTRDSVIDYIRLNQASFEEEECTQISQSELAEIAPLAHDGCVIKTINQGSQITEVFLAFKIDSDYQTANIAHYIGDDAAIVSNDDVAYSQNWAIGIGDGLDFNPGDLIFRIVHDFSDDDKNRFLHRGTFGGDRLNQMQRTLHMNHFNIYNVSSINGNMANITTARVKGTLTAENIESSNVQFDAGAEVDNRNLTLNFNNLNVVNGGSINGIANIDSNLSELSEVSAQNLFVNPKVVFSQNLNLVSNVSTRIPYFKTIQVNSDLYIPSVETANLPNGLFVISGFWKTLFAEYCGSRTEDNCQHLVLSNPPLKPFYNPAYFPIPSFKSLVIDGIGVSATGDLEGAPGVPLVELSEVIFDFDEDNPGFFKDITCPEWPELCSVGGGGGGGGGGHHEPGVPEPPVVETQ